MKRLLFWRKKIEKTILKTKCSRCYSTADDEEFIKVRRFGTGIDRFYCVPCLRTEISEGGVFEIL